MRTSGSYGGDLSEGRRWTAGVASRMLTAWRKSDLSLPEFAREQGVNVQRLYWWRKRLMIGGGAMGEQAALPNEAATSMAFIPAMLSDAAGPARLAVRLPGGVEIEAAGCAGLPVEWVAALARELAGKR